MIKKIQAIVAKEFHGEKTNGFHANLAKELGAARKMEALKKTKVVRESLMTVGEVAERLHVSKETVRRLTESRAMPQPIRLGRSVRYHGGVIDSWLADGGKDLSKQKRPR